MGRVPCCQKEGLKKGPWTPEEDQKLIAYIEKHGHENWRALPKRCGLLRCGKSCRLRWTNYLRPDIKRGRFSQSEEQKIIQLHALVGNKWSFIASQLPKRTDNEIKNYWNTVLKKRMQKISSMFANAQRLLEQKPTVTAPPPPPPDEDHSSSASALGSWSANTSSFTSAGPPCNARAMPGAATSNSSSTGCGGGSSSFSHLAQWESARLQAEARLAKESRSPKTKPNSWLTPPTPHLTSGSSTAGHLPSSPSTATYLKQQQRRENHLDMMPDLSAGNFLQSPSIGKAADLSSPLLLGSGGVVLEAAQLSSEHNINNNNCSSSSSSSGAKLSWKASSGSDAQLLKNMGSGSSATASATTTTTTTTREAAAPQQCGQKRTYWQSYPAPPVCGSSYQRIDVHHNDANGTMGDMHSVGKELEDIRSSGSSSAAEDHLRRRHHQVSVDGALASVLHGHSDDDYEHPTSGRCDGVMHTNQGMISAADLENLNQILAQMEEQSGCEAAGFIGSGGEAAAMGGLTPAGMMDGSADMSQHTSVLLDMINSANESLMGMRGMSEEVVVDGGGYLGGEFMAALHHHHHNHMHHHHHHEDVMDMQQEQQQQHQMMMMGSSSDMMLPKLSHHYGEGTAMDVVSDGTLNLNPRSSSSSAACFHMDVDDDVVVTTLPGGLQYDSLVRELLES